MVGEESTGECFLFEVKYGDMRAESVPGLQYFSAVGTEMSLTTGTARVLSPLPLRLSLDLILTQVTTEKALWVRTSS